MGGLTLQIRPALEAPAGQGTEQSGLEEMQAAQQPHVAPFPVPIGVSNRAL